MKMPTTAASFQPCPSGNHLATCYEVIDFGTQTDKFGDEEKVRHVIWIGWELPEELMEDGRPFIIGREYTFSSHEKASLRQDLEAWRGVPFRDSDFGPDGAFDIRNVIGVGCYLTVIHKEKQNGTIGSRVRCVGGSLRKGQKAAPLQNPPRYVALVPGEFDVDAYESLGDWMKERIARSPEFKALTQDRSGKVAKPVDADPQDDGDDCPF